MIRISVCLISFLILLAASLNAQDRVAPRKQASAIRIPDGSIHIDGRLDEEVWRQAAPITDFVQKEPNEGAAPAEQIEVRIAYDDRAVYIGAHMYNRQGGRIQAPLGRRDGIEDQAEYLLVSMDTFHDRLTAYSFGVTPAGVRIDRYYPQDDETHFDEGFDPVWEAKTSNAEQGWTAELWIPFSQLRFNDQEQQVWGLNLQRFTPTSNEMDYWTPVPRTQRGWASRFGDLLGMEGIRPTKRIELLPYVAESSAINGGRDRANPFDNGRNLKSRTGADLKMGVGPNLTLDATVNPDFRQVEADPAEVNLTPFETFFTEKRPFFTEGSRLLNLTQITNFFYSRRIGAPPTAPVPGGYDFVDYAETSTILGALKLTGRLRGGTSVGVLGAVTDEESASASRRGSSAVDEIRVAPRTGYGLIQMVQEFGASHSTATVMASAVHRDLKSTDPLAALLSRNAYASASEAILRFKDGQYELRPFFGLVHVEGETGAIARLQRSPLRYYQRPDQNYVVFDPTRTTLDGYTTGANFERTGGRHWLWYFHLNIESPGFEPNDIGRLSSADGTTLTETVRYRETAPGNVFRSYSIGLTQRNEWNYGRDRMHNDVKANLTATLLNFWTATLESGPNYRSYDERLTRGGPMMQTPAGWSTTATLRNRPAAPTIWNGSFMATTDEDGGQSITGKGGVSFRSATRWQLSLGPNYVREKSSQQYVTTLAGNRPETYGQRYVFSHIERSTLSTQFRLGYTLKPDVNIDVYAEPFTASGRYYDFGELAAPRNRNLRVYGTDGTTVVKQSDGSRVVTDGPENFTLKNYDFNVRSFRSNVVLKWEWRPGSTLYVVWQQNRRLSEPFGERVSVGDLFRSLTATGSNIFVVKMSFWLPVK
jgi:hypothetical protein